MRKIDPRVAQLQCALFSDADSKQKTRSRKKRTKVPPASNVFHVVGPDNKRVRSNELSSGRARTEKTYTPRWAAEAAARRKAYRWCISRIAKLRQQYEISDRQLEAICRKNTENFYGVLTERYVRACKATIYGALCEDMFNLDKWGDFSTAERAHLLALAELERQPNEYNPGPAISDAGLAAIKNEALRLIKALAERVPAPVMDKWMQLAAPREVAL